jgi:DNA-binding NarL/FixJ family response regulator
MTTRSIVACVDDLFFRSKIEATARHLNVPVRFADAKDLPNAAAREDTAAVLLEVSSDGEPLEAVRKLRRERRTSELPIIGFLKHTDRELAKQAESAGFTRVLPRSEFSETLPDLVMDLLAPGTKREMQEEPELPDE